MESMEIIKFHYTLPQAVVPFELRPADYSAYLEKLQFDVILEGLVWYLPEMVDGHVCLQNACGKKLGDDLLVIVNVCFGPLSHYEFDIMVLLYTESEQGSEDVDMPEA